MRVISTERIPVKMWLDDIEGGAIEQAKGSLGLETEKKRLNDQGIVHNIRSVDDLDEASGAYKPIETVMKNQADLVDVSVELSPLAVIKG